jgi:hypothetical protein
MACVCVCVLLCGLVVSFSLLTQRSRVRFPALPDFSEYQWVWNGVHSALVRVNEELLERKNSGSGLEN